MTCLDDPIYVCKEGSYNFDHLPVIVAYDPEPGDMALLPQNLLVQKVANDLVTFNEYDVQPRMWTDISTTGSDLTDGFTLPAQRQMLFWGDVVDGHDNGEPAHDFFTTILENGTTTGVLREHATRFNSSVQCKSIPKQSFPHNCSGTRPFEASYSRPGYLDVRVCAPGEYGVSPWTEMRDRQDIEEELFLDVTVWPSIESSPSWFNQTNFTIHCTAQTTRGYFEIGNYRNGYRYGPLIDKWPSPQEMQNDWNDHLTPVADYKAPTNNGSSSFAEGNPFMESWGTEPPDPYGTYDLLASGPLMTSAIAIFGNESFFHVAKSSPNSTEPPVLNQLCQQNTVPFGRLDLVDFNDWQGSCSPYRMNTTLSTPDESDVPTMLWLWIGNFQNLDVSSKALMASMFLANQAMLTITSAATMTLGARQIYAEPGHELLKPALASGARVVISLLIALQLVGIVVTVWYIYRTPAWTYALDALAVARIGRGLDDGDLPPIGPVSDADKQRLSQVDGLIGVEDDLTHGNASSGDAGMRSTIRLALGGKGLISHRLVRHQTSQATDWTNQDASAIHMKP